jgi:hypothetical protein
MERVSCYGRHCTLHPILSHTDQLLTLLSALLQMQPVLLCINAIKNVADPTALPRGAKVRFA